MGKGWLGFKTRVEWCSETGKACYDKRTAQTAINHRFAKDHTRLRMYPCPQCQREGKPCWHLTSRVGTDYRRHGEKGLERRDWDDEL